MSELNRKATVIVIIIFAIAIYSCSPLSKDTTADFKLSDTPVPSTITTEPSEIIPPISSTEIPEDDCTPIINNIATGLRGELSWSADSRYLRFRLSEHNDREWHEFDTVTNELNPIPPISLPSVIEQYGDLLPDEVKPRHIYKSPSGTKLVYILESYLSTPTGQLMGETFIGHPISNFYFIDLQSDDYKFLGQIRGGIDEVRWDEVNGILYLIFGRSSPYGRFTYTLSLISFGEFNKFDPIGSYVYSISPSGEKIIYSYDDSMWMKDYSEGGDILLPVHSRFHWWYPGEESMVILDYSTDQRYWEFVDFDLSSGEMRVISPPIYAIHLSSQPYPVLSPDLLKYAYAVRDDETNLLNLDLLTMCENDL